MSGSPPPTNQSAIATYLDELGRDTAKSVLATPGSVDQMFIGPRQAIPIVFLPGIMGSPLIATGANLGMWGGQGKWAWFPDNAWWVVWGYGNLSPAQRSTLLNPAHTRAVEAPTDADVDQLKKACQGAWMPWQEAQRRGWGSVMLTSYGPFLQMLERRMGMIFQHGIVQPSGEHSSTFTLEDVGDLVGYRPLDEAMLRRAAGWRYPVYAVGYNWLQSNGEAAKSLKPRVDAILSDCRERLNLRCTQVILVTHSMGGLVGRAYAKNYPDDVLGVVHGVQPAIGAATAYARVRAGWDSNGSAASWIGAKSLGETGHEVSAVFAGAAGPLELLPTQAYGPGWLKVKSGTDSDDKSLFTLPKADPYEEIYKEGVAWWRLIHPGSLLPPENRISGDLKSAWTAYIEQLRVAQTFHSRLGEYYHPKTYAHCGVDKNQRTWRQIIWKIETMRSLSTGAWARAVNAETIRTAITTADQMTGSCEIVDRTTAGPVMVNRNGVGVTRQSGGEHYRAWLGPKNESGDATVPAHSGTAPKEKVTFFATLKGFEHQDSYQSADVQKVALYSIISLSKDAKNL